MAKINEIDITSLIFQEGSVPSTPAATKWKSYFKTTGMFVVDDAGAETGPLAAGGGLGAWTSYTPTLTAVTTNPTVGDGTLSGRYKALDATTYAVLIYFAFGSTSTAGSGEWKFLLPNSETSGTVPQVLACHMLDAGTRRYTATGLIAASATVVWPIAVADASGTFIVSHNVPFTWANGDTIQLSGIIETT